MIASALTHLPQGRETFGSRRREILAPVLAQLKASAPEPENPRQLCEAGLRCSGVIASVG